MTYKSLNTISEILSYRRWLIENGSKFDKVSELANLENFNLWLQYSSLNIIFKIWSRLKDYPNLMNYKVQIHQWH